MTAFRSLRHLARDLAHAWQVLAAGREWRKHPPRLPDDVLATTISDYRAAHPEVTRPVERPSREACTKARPCAACRGGVAR